uniref:flagellin n=1 Tax=Loktanella salsilacus TaxID=195913 RepID=UPI003565C4CC
MSSILTNNGAMVALQTLNNINKNLGETQSAISTGKAVSTAKDNAAVWSISKTMESDVQGFKAISSSLSIGESSVAVARSAAEGTTDLLKSMKEKIVAAQDGTVDRATLQTDIDALKAQISSVVGSAQFTGVNLVNDSAAVTVDTDADGTADAKGIQVVSSLDRDNTGAV